MAMHVRHLTRLCNYEGTNDANVHVLGGAGSKHECESDDDVRVSQRLKASLIVH